MTQIASGWTIVCPADHNGDYMYIAETCRCGVRVAHTLDDALACGLLRAVRAHRDLSQEATARQLGVTTSAICRWEQSSPRQPTGLYREALEGWICEGGDD